MADLKYLKIQDAILNPQPRIQLVNPAPPHILRSRSLSFPAGSAQECQVILTQSLSIEYNNSDLHLLI